MTSQGPRAPSCSPPRGRRSRTWAGQGSRPHHPPRPRRPHPQPPSWGPGSSSAWWGSTGRGFVQPRQQPRDSWPEPSRTCPWLRGPGRAPGVRHVLDRLAQQGADGTVCGSEAWWVAGTRPSSTSDYGPWGWEQRGWGVSVHVQPEAERRPRLSASSGVRNFGAGFSKSLDKSPSYPGSGLQDGGQCPKPVPSCHPGH